MGCALIIQNGDIYEDQWGPKYEMLKKYWAHPTLNGRKQLSLAVSEKGFRDEFVGEVAERLIDKISPDLWKLSWPLMQSPKRREIGLEGRQIHRISSQRALRLHATKTP